MRFALTTVVVWGCAGAEDPPADTGTGTPSTEDPCRGEVMEEDFSLGDLPPPMDPANWPPMPPDAIVSTTYLQLTDTPAAMQAFGESVGPIAGVIESAPGLMGLSFASSAACGTERTLSVWATEGDMMAFVTGPEHAAAMSRALEISRGNSITMSWTAADLEEVTWAAVITALAAHDRPGF